MLADFLTQNMLTNVYLFRLENYKTDSPILLFFSILKEKRFTYKKNESQTSAENVNTLWDI